jgi:hypothetical protein
MPITCRGEFSEETKQQLRDKYKNDPSALLFERCPLCDTSIVAENKGGQWVPETHSPPVKRVYKGAGGKRVVGKTLIRGCKYQSTRSKKSKKSPATKRNVYKR